MVLRGGGPACGVVLDFPNPSKGWPTGPKGPTATPYVRLCSQFYFVVQWPEFVDQGENQTSEQLQFQLPRSRVHLQTLATCFHLIRHFLWSTQIPRTFKLQPKWDTKFKFYILIFDESVKCCTSIQRNWIKCYINHSERFLSIMFYQFIKSNKKNLVIVQIKFIIYLLLDYYE